VVEHDLDVVASADRVVDLGPGAVPDGGRVVFEGPPAAPAGSGTLTGQHLAAHTTARPAA
jgi:excinuclease UvrABC ATPase subunit